MRMRFDADAMCILYAFKNRGDPSDEFILRTLYDIACSNFPGSLNFASI